ncbi:unnamed protein product, partial [Amoebophrya sp. A25]|eukprot:GSA25T00014185001.1
MDAGTVFPPGVEGFHPSLMRREKTSSLLEKCDALTGGPDTQGLPPGTVARVTFACTILQALVMWNVGDELLPVIELLLTKYKDRVHADARAAVVWVYILKLKRKRPEVPSEKDELHLIDRATGAEVSRNVP